MILPLLQRWEMPLRRSIGRVLGPALAFTPTLPALRSRLLKELDIDLLIDVGANIGQYAAQTRLYGYRGDILSIEPLSSAFAALATRAARDEGWQSRNLALGARAGRATLHVSANSQSSSLLPMLPLHLHSAPTSQVVGSEDVALSTLAELLADISARRIFVKIDAQGGESAILDGAGAALQRIAGLELELSLSSLYAGEKLFGEIVARLEAERMLLVQVTPGLRDPRTNAVLQVDALFRRA